MIGQIRYGIKLFGKSESNHLKTNNDLVVVVSFMSGQPLVS